MSHEQSETIQREDGKWINVYGKKTPNAGKQLPNSGEYSTVDEAVTEAKKRSEDFGNSSDNVLRRGYFHEEHEE